MPTISQFFGIFIRMFFDDPAPPHFHAKYNEHLVVISISPWKYWKGISLAELWAWCWIGRNCIKQNC